MNAHVSEKLQPLLFQSFLFRSPTYTLDGMCNRPGCPLGCQDGAPSVGEAWSQLQIDVFPRNGIVRVDEVGELQPELHGRNSLLLNYLILIT
jgi:hypothetical protein